MASPQPSYGATAAQQQQHASNNLFRSLHSSGSHKYNDRLRGNNDSSAVRGVAPQCKHSSEELPLVWNNGEKEDDEKMTARKISSKKGEGGGGHTLFHSLIYAIINVIIAVPGLYGYASVIFNHPAFGPHMNALAKLVIFSSFVHQLGFTIFSSLDFAIGTVQDAGLIFLSAMANTIANSILDEGGTVDEVVSTTLVLLSLGTAALGLVLVFLGKFRLLDIVSYLPMPVIGGYLAFIGYFCLEAGVALCISKPMTTLGDWGYLFDPHSLLLATPGLLSALLLTIISRKATNDAILPIAMVLIPATFYAILFVGGVTLEDARAEGWVGQEAPPVPVKDLLHLVDFGLVHWNLVSKCIGTWVGMVFVVSFASCLDIAAVSMDMGEALNTNKEMVTVGTANFMSGCLFGFTGSYIFSQTIFTYRTGCHSRYIGIFIMVAYLCVCASTVNILEIVPLYFFGATLVFIGYDLLWEWLIDIRSKIFLTEYFILLTTFVAIQIIGMDFGILFGVVVALVEHVASTTHRESTLDRVAKRSRAVWATDDWNILQTYGYNMDDPKIVTLEVKGPVFFGSSQKLLQDITDEINLSISDDEMKRIAFASPHPSTPHSSLRVRPLQSSKRFPSQRRIYPQYLVLDMTQMSNLDASAATSCFLQLAKMCEKRGIFLCAAGVTPRVEWMLRSHHVAYSFEEEIDLKNSMLSDSIGHATTTSAGKLMLFLTIFEALEFSERLLIRRVSMSKIPSEQNLQFPLSSLSSVKEGTHHQLTYIFLNVLRGELSEQEKDVIDKDISAYVEEIKYRAGESVFQKNTHPEAFFVVTSGSVAVPRSKRGTLPSMVLSGAGKIEQTRTLSSPDLLGSLCEEGKHASVESFHKVGGIFGYCDFLLERYRTFDAVASAENTVVATFTRTSMDKMKDENRPLYNIVQNLLLRASLMDLANCTCHN